MAALRIALAQVSLGVGAFSANIQTVLAHAADASAAGADVVAFPELTLCGYPPEDLVLRPAFLDANAAALAELSQALSAAGLDHIAVVVGLLTRSASGRPYNSAAVLHGGTVIARYAKRHLPNYGVFDEDRYFEQGTEDCVFEINDHRVGLVICEDIWEQGPAESTGALGVELLLVINGSPFEIDKFDVRLDLCRTRALATGVALAYVNQVGGQDELVFDGDSLVVSAAGALIARASQFIEELLVVEVSSGGPIAPHLSELEQIWSALVLGTRDYVVKNGFSSVVLGLSGGIDSAVVATIAVDALGSRAVHTVALPSDWSSQHSLDDAADLAARQGTTHSVLPIGALVEAYAKSVTVDGVALENLQARVRGVILMALSNQHGHIVLTTGNKSELATGFSTLYGDAAGGFGPIKDVPKTLVWELARWRNTVSEVIPISSIEKPPSAELAPGQLDSDRLPDYDILDPILDAYVRHDLGRSSIIAQGFDAAVVDRVIRLVDLAEYKRRQYPPGPKVTSKAFGRDRRLPITHAWREG